MTFADAMRRAGWGRDEEGDRRRREAMRSAHLTPEELARLHDRGVLSSPYLRRALAAEADRIAAEAAQQMPADRRVPADPPPVPGHLLTQERTATGNTVVRCQCGRWDGGWTGPRSRRRVLDDYAAHVAAELAASGPLRVVSERADQPKELEP